MSTHPDHFRPQDSAGSQQYLDAAVRTASPAKLRLMLIQRGIQVAESLSQQWRSGQSEGPNEHSIKLLDLLNELLGGVTAGATAGENDVCSRVADLYVFLIQHLVAAERASDADSIDEIALVLKTEEETWRAVCAGQAIPQPASTPQAAGLNFEA